MTRAERQDAARAADAALRRAERAAILGDIAGSVIAATDARRLMRRLDADRMAAR